MDIFSMMPLDFLIACRYHQYGKQQWTLPHYANFVNRSRGGILLRVLDAPKAAAVLQQQGVKAAVPADQPDTLQLPPLPDEALAALVCTLAESGVGVVGLTAQTKSLEDIFLSLTQTSGEVA